jgi:hypothetical protein
MHHFLLPHSSNFLISTLLSFSFLPTQHVVTYNVLSPGQGDLSLYSTSTIIVYILLIYFLVYSLYPGRISHF